MDMKRDFKGVWIPREIWLDQRLSLTEKFLLMEIDSLDGADGCFATNEYLAEFIAAGTRKTSYTPEHISGMIGALKKYGLVTQESPEGARRVLRSNVKTGYIADPRMVLKPEEAKPKKRKSERILDETKFTILREEGFGVCWQRWLAHYKERNRHTMTTHTAENYLEWATLHGAEKFRAWVKRAIDGGWKGFRPDWFEGKKTHEDTGEQSQFTLRNGQGKK